MVRVRVRVRVRELAVRVRGIVRVRNNAHAVSMAILPRHPGPDYG